MELIEILTCLNTALLFVNLCITGKTLQLFVTYARIDVDVSQCLLKDVQRRNSNLIIPEITPDETDRPN